MAATEAVPVLLKPQRWRRGLFLLLGCLGVLAFGLGYWWWHGRQDQVNYISLPVNRGSIVNAINAAGKVEAVKSIGLDFKSSGVIKAIYVQPGDRVKAGQVLACLDTADLEAQLAQARANLEAAEAKLRLLQAGPLDTEIAQAEANVAQALVAYNSAEETLKRNQALFDAGALAQVDLDNSTANRDTAAAKLRQAQAALEALRNGSRSEDIVTAQAQVDAARAQLALAENNLAGAWLRAPWEGIISAVRGEVGQRIGSGSSDETKSFVTLVTPKLRLRAQVNEADIGKIQVGQAATFTVNAFPEKTFKGEVTWISPEATTVANVQLYDVLISLADSNIPLKAGMSTNINIIVEQKDNVVTVPRAAVTFAANNQGLTSNNAAGRPAAQGGSAGRLKMPEERETGTKVSAPGDGTGKGTQGQGENDKNKVIVLVLEQGRPVARQIVTGLSDERNIEVRSGLEVGEQVIIGTSTPGKPAASSSSPLGPQQPVNLMRGVR